MVTVICTWITFTAQTGDETLLITLYRQLILLLFLFCSIKCDNVLNKHLKPKDTCIFSHVSCWHQ